MHHIEHHRCQVQTKCRPAQTKLYLLAAILILFRLTLSAAPAASPIQTYVEGEVLVTFNKSVNLENAGKTASLHSLEFVRHFRWLSEHHGQVYAHLRSRSATTDQIISRLQRDPAVAKVEPNYLRWICDLRVPNDPLFSQLWAMQNTGQAVTATPGSAGADISFLPAWGLARPSTGEVVVATVDTGIDYTHPDLVPNLWTNRAEIPGNGVDDDGNGYTDDVLGYDFAGGTGNPMDSGDHGTHVAGTIAAAGNNNVGVIGVCFTAHIMALKVSNDGSSLTTSAIIEAVQYAAMMKQRGVNVVAINESFGGGSPSSAEIAAIQAAGDVGIVVCAAAGNNTSNNDTTPFYPASYRLPNMIVVAASDQNDNLASFSNYGASTVDIAAPGVNILSALPVSQAGTTSFVQQASVTYTAAALQYSGSTTGITAAFYNCGLGNPSDFPAAVNGNIALIQRGTLYFSDKVSNAMAAGARAAIIYNNAAGTFSGTLQYASSWIPALAISQADGQALLAGLPGLATTVNAPDASRIYQYLDGTSMATPHVAGAVAFAAMNFPAESASARVQRIVASATALPNLAGSVASGGRLNLSRVVDSDQNGLPDWWEQMYFGQLTGTDPTADPDNDGASNLQEFISDTNPTNAASFLKVTSLASYTNGFLLKWSGGINARQYIQRNNNFGDPASWITLKTNEPPTPAYGGFLDTLPAVQSGLYRIQVERP